MNYKENDKGARLFKEHFHLFMENHISDFCHSVPAAV